MLTQLSSFSTEALTPIAGASTAAQLSLIFSQFPVVHSACLFSRHALRIMILRKSAWKKATVFAEVRDGILAQINDSECCP